MVASVGISNFSSVSNPINSISCSRCATIWSFVPFSIYAKFLDRLRCRGTCAYNEFSIICGTRSPKSRLGHSFTSSRKFESDSVLGSEVSLCHLSFAVPCDCDLTYFRRIRMNTSSSVRLLLALMFLNVCNASLLNCERRWLILIASDVSGCILSIVWERSSKSSNILFFLSKINVFVVVSKINVDNVWGRCWDAIPKIASASRSTGLTESECCVWGVFAQPLVMCCRVECVFAYFVVG